jgi:hypothetical protein
MFGRRCDRQGSLGPSLLVLGALVVSMLSGCATTLLKDEVTKQTDGWTMNLWRLTDGPNSITPSGHTMYEPAAGQRLIHAYFKFTNDAPKERVFSYNACDLDLDDTQVVLPSLVTRAAGLMTVIDDKESYPPHDSSNRCLTFSYPIGRMPTRIRCAGVAIEIPRQPAGH